MSTKELVVDVSHSEIAIALLEDKKLVELSKESANSRFSVGDLYLARVKKIMPGLNAAFVDVGHKRDAFLHYLDLGPQFRSLAKYLQIALQSKPLPPLSRFKREKDIDKNGKIGDVLKGGQQIVVQIAKEPISTKGPRLTSEISIAGRNLVLMPFSDKVSISQKISNKEEKDRLKNLLTSIRPKNYGVIVRTMAENQRVAELDTELRELVDKWEKSIFKLRKARPPKLVLGEVSRTTAILRDILNDSFNHIYVNDANVYNEIKNYIGDISPDQQKIVKLYSGKTNIFEHHSVTKQIKTYFGRTVPMKKGAYLVIEHTEALHSIDVNSGNRNKDATNQEENAIDVNMVAAEEIARQLRLRDMGGIVVVDFIDMQKNENKQKLLDFMKQEMSKDRAKHHILPLSKFGLMQITRQRVRPETNISTIETCPTCKGTGEIQPPVLIVDEIQDKIRYGKLKKPKGRIELRVHPFLQSYLTKGFINRRLKWRFKYNKKVTIKADQSYTFLEYNFFDRKGNMLNL
ncbi:Rne/Rng family ribonuclease [Salinivirga cyanobacteriivorans]